jgi:hypothetical protein
MLSEAPADAACASLRLAGLAPQSPAVQLRACNTMQL